MHIIEGSFSVTSICPRFGDEIGMAIVSFGRTQHTTLARRGKDGTISLAGFVGRYRTSTNPWLASVRIYANGRVSCHFGRDDRSGRFNKQNMISFEPETYRKLANMRHWGVIDEAY